MSFDMPYDSTSVYGVLPPSPYLTPPRRTVGKVMLEPFPDQSVKVSTAGEGSVKVAFLANTKNQLVRLKVLASCGVLSNGSMLEVAKEGGTVLVRADLYSSDWGKTVFTTPGTEEKFILLPVERVEVFE